jgi:uncharacterized protein (TIGR03435 family)
MMRCGAVVLMLPLAVGLLAQSPPTPPNSELRFEAVSVKRNLSGEDGGGTRTFPNRWEAINVPLQVVILQGHNLRPHQLIGGPGWVMTEKLDVRATAGRDATFDEMRGMVRTLLAERFKLVAHIEKRDVRAWDMVLDNKKLGPALRPCQTECNGRGSIGSGKWVNQGAPTSYIATVLAAYVNAPVADRSGLEDRYAFEVSWTIPEGQQDAPGANAAAFVEAVRERLGLKLEPSRATIDVLVIDSVERPAPD